MADELKILDGSFKGVPIAIASGEVQGGRKTVTHTFPSRDTQSVEDLGLKPRSYTLELIIRGDDYFGYRNRLLAALESDSPGELIHPMYGRLTNMKAVSFSLNESFGSFGDAVISAKFEPDTSTGIPKAAGNVVTQVRTAQQQVSAAVSADIADQFVVTPGFTGNFAAATGKVQGIIDAANEATQFIGQAATDLNQFSAQIGDLSASVNSLVTNPLALADSIVNLFESVNGLYASADATFQTMLGFFGFGNTDTPISRLTAGLDQRATNAGVLNGAANALALSYAYLAATEVQIQTVRDIDAISLALDGQYLSVQESSVSDEVKGLITDQRVLTLQVLDETRLTAPQIIQVETNTTSTRLLSFDYYGSDELGEDLANLNGVTDVSFVSGAVEVVTQ